MRNTTGHILVVDDNIGIRSALKMLLPLHFASVRCLPHPKTLLSELRENPADVVLLDMNFDVEVNTGNEGLFWLAELRRQMPSIRVVLFTAYADVNLAVEGMKGGAFDFVTKPWDNAHLVEILHKAVAASPTTVAKAKKTEKPVEMFWGDSPAMKALLCDVEKIADTDATVLITGENGTGKDLLASEIHSRSGRSGHSFVAVDVGAIPETLFESEMFGAVKGAYTDSVKDRSGKIETASGGTLFLDEIGNLSLSSQAKLLRVLQDRQLCRVGSDRPIAVDIRLICATNKDLLQEVAEGRFREDLFYRINTLHLHLPALRERAADIPHLAQLFVDRFTSKYSRPATSISADQAALLKRLYWNGNIRELQNVIERAVILSDSGGLNLNGLGSAERGQVTNGSSTGTLEDMEQQMIRDSLDRNAGNLTLVAQQLGITRQTLYNKLKKYDIHC